MNNPITIVTQGVVHSLSTNVSENYSPSFSSVVFSMFMATCTYSASVGIR